MHRIIHDNLKQIKILCKSHNVRALFAFGSVCTDKFTQESDIDLLISFGSMPPGDYADNYFDVADKFEEIFRRRVDLITDKSLENPYFIASVNQTKTLLYEQ